MIYILAQGVGSRWITDSRRPIPLPSEYKQQIPINGESNLFRTIRMLDERGQSDYKVIARGEMFSPSQLDKLINKVVTLQYAGTILEGIHQLLYRKHGNGDLKPVIFLLGDVIFSHACLDTILDDKHFYTLFGRNKSNKVTGKQASEIFALKAGEMFWPLLLDQLHIQKNMAGSTKLWNLLNGYFSGNFVEIDDYTDDIDSLEEYEQFFKKLEAAAREDDKV